MPLSRSDCLFIHIPKCAGTSVEVALGVAENYPEIGLKPTRTQPHFATLFGGGLQHLTIKEIVRNFPAAVARKRLFSFSVIRDPVDRFISHFLWKHYRFSEGPLDHANVLNAFLEETEQLIALSHELDVFQNPFEGFEYCQGDTQSLLLNDLRRHLLPQCAYIFDRGAVPIIAIYPITKLSALESKLSRRGALTNPIPFRMVGTASKQLGQMIPASTERGIKEVYRYDVRLNAHTREMSDSNCEGFCPGKEIDVTKLIDHIASGATRRTSHIQTYSSIPRHLWMYWHQGWNAAPLIVQKCAESWLKKNPSWQINFLTAKTVHEIVRLPKYIANLHLPLPALSDVIRIHILAQYGGIWADATTWCARPLDEWLEYVVARSGFFAYAKPAPSRPISSWFIAAYPEHYIVDRLKLAADEFWKREAKKQFGATHSTDEPGSKNYFWFHELFCGLLQTDPTLFELWEKTPQISADAPHFLQAFGLAKPATPEIIFHIRNKLSNVYKLNRRIDLPNQIEGTVVGALFETLK